MQQKPQAPAIAQRKRRSAQRPAPKPKPKSKPTPTPDMREEASQVATQIKNVSNFIYVYGKVVSSFEVAKEQAQNNQTSPEIQARYKKSKDELVTSINMLRIGLENLARSFQANQRLQVQYLKLSYATEAVYNAERLAAAGRYDDAGKSLITAVERLTDTIISMRLL